MDKLCHLLCLFQSLRAIEGSRQRGYVNVYISAVFTCILRFAGRMGACEHIIFERSIHSYIISVISGFHSCIREVKNIILEQDLVSLVYRMHCIIVDKCVVIYSCVLYLCIDTLADTHDNRLMAA